MESLGRKKNMKLDTLVSPKKNQKFKKKKKIIDYLNKNWIPRYLKETGYFGVQKKLFLIDNLVSEQKRDISVSEGKLNSLRPLVNKTEIGECRQTPKTSVKDRIFHYILAH